MTGLLYLIVIGMWAAVLLPIFLKKYDQNQLNKSVGIDQRTKPWRLQPKFEATPRQQAFVRRRRVVMTLLTSFILSFLAGLSGLMSLKWSLLPSVLLIAFVYVAIKQGTTIASSSPRAPIVLSTPNVDFRNQDTVAIDLTQSVVEPVSEPVKNTWVPVEPPVPAYVKAARASVVPRGIESTKPWTGQDMVEHAAKLRAEHAQRIKDAQRRLEEARALSMEKARRAALAVRPASSTPQSLTDKKASNE